jgi:hypothetical protein
MITRTVTTSTLYHDCPDTALLRQALASAKGAPAHANARAVYDDLDRGWRIMIETGARLVGYYAAPQTDGTP